MIAGTEHNPDIWQAYLRELPAHHDLSSVNTIALEKLLATRVPSVLTTKEESCIRVTDVRNGRSDSFLCETPDALQQALAVEGGKLRIVSIYSVNAFSPLKISPALMADIFLRYSVHPAFIQVLLSFGSNVHVSEAGNNYLFAGKDGNDSYMTYQINYVEEKHHPRGLLWSWRHTGVYHHHCVSSGGEESDLFILLHPTEDSVYERRIQNELQLPPSQNIPSEPTIGREHSSQLSTALHSLAVSSFSGNWRWYLRDLGKKFEKHNDLALVAVPEDATPLESYDMLSSLRDLNDSALRAQVCCRGSLELVERLKAATFSGTLGTTENTLERAITACDAMGTELRGYLASCDELIPRIRNAIDLVSKIPDYMVRDITAGMSNKLSSLQAGYTLSLHNQLDTAKIDRELRDLIGHLEMLQRDSVDDSAAVKIITFLSAVYLPGSFIVSLYGMNFFVFDTDARQIVIAHDFWVFIATWIPLTLATGLVYVLIVWFDAWWKRKPFNLFARPAKITQLQSPRG